MKPRITTILVLACLLATGCATTTRVSDTNFKRPSASRLIVMQPDISAGVFTAGGLFEKREDWSKQAIENISQAIVKFEAESSATTTKVVLSADGTGADPKLVSDLTRLHDAVGHAIKVHKYSNEELPTKKGKFDWTLGASAVEFGKQANYDYALFLYAKDSFASGGRKALVAASYLTCIIACITASAGSQEAFASLVDLKSGEVVWFNTYFSGSGDIRTPEGAEELVTGLLKTSNVLQ